MREKNLAMFHDTMQIIERGGYEVNGRYVPLKLSREQMMHAIAHIPEDVERIFMENSAVGMQHAGRCHYACVNEDSFSLARRRAEEYARLLAAQEKKEVLVLNLANPVNPGGGVRKGSTAQEEDLCRKSSLLLSLEGGEALPYYAYNRGLKTFMGTNGIVITPQVEIIKDSDGNLLDESAVVTVMTCAAPMINYGLEGMTQEQYEDMLYKRIERMLACAAHYGYRVLVLGAFGCGAFMNDAKLVSDMFAQAFRSFNYGGLTADEAFASVDFGVLCRGDRTYNYEHFSRNFNHFD
ncbi:MAG: TIGR02452 family protein [Clostridia bacterium]|nr:TIGR02452 family protein [Clostridia bacterium]